VQGVGFRPFVYGLATELGLTGWVNNTSQGAAIAIEGHRVQIDAFLQRLQQDKPPHCTIQHLEVQFQTQQGFDQFKIQASAVDSTQPKSAVILPDLATCPACLKELFDPGDRRYRYPFTNCTHCGPRFSILRSLPYDRPNTTMRHFPMCPMCQTEYSDPLNRRFHAQPNACPNCGPHLELWNQQGTILASHDEALVQTAHAIRQGKVVAIKGLGGFHLVVDARNQIAVQTLRQRKHRPDKPLAVMFANLAQIRAHCQMSEAEAQWLSATEAPIVLLARRSEALEEVAIASAVAPGNPYWGAMLPYTPLHHLLLADLGFPIVATSGNRSSEPICIDEQQALQALGDIADVFLVHNRPIACPVDDSIGRVIQDQVVVLRRARGYAPLPISIPGEEQPNSVNILAVGAHLKNTIALSVQQQMIASQHLGDLDNPQTLERFQAAVHQLLSLYETQPGAIACDAHPDYVSSQFAQTFAANAEIAPPAILPIQHHYAHVLSCMVDNQLKPPVLGIAWDGTGYGLDGTIWGGEFLLIPEQSSTPAGFERVAHLRPFSLPGGEQAVKEPRRAALGLLYECLGEAVFERTDLAPVQVFSSTERSMLKTMLAQGLNTPTTSSAGRLFDAIASLLNLCHRASFEGQAAMQLEFAIPSHPIDECYPYALRDGISSDQQPDAAHSPLILDWQPMLIALLDDWQAGQPTALISTKVHNTLVATMVAIAQALHLRYPTLQHIALTGGCFQNRYLLERSLHHFAIAGFTPVFHRRIPTNDGGIAIGQILAALRQHDF
jgi:hydrogenase maturation protein HypF